MHLLSVLLGEGARTPGAPTGAAASADAPGGVVLPVLGKLGIDAVALRDTVQTALAELPVLGADSPSRDAWPSPAASW